MPNLTRRRKIAYAAVVVVGFFALLEAGLRLLPESTASSAASLELSGAHRTRGWALKPGTQDAFGATFTATADGIRQTPETGAPHRILTTGDSSIFGHGLPEADTLHARLRVALSRQSVDTDVMTLAVPGYSSAQTRVVLDEVGWDLEPALLVIGNLWSDSEYGPRTDAEMLAGLGAADLRLQELAENLAIWRTLAGLLSVRSAGERIVTWGQRHGERTTPRVPVPQYINNLNAMLDEAAARQVGVVILQLCDTSQLTHGQAAFSQAWIDAMVILAGERKVPLVLGCDALRAHQITDTQQAFLDGLHPTAASNAAYASSLAALLTGSGWPARQLTPAPQQ